MDRFTTMLAAAGLLAASAPELGAQQKWTFDGRGGVAVPVSDLEELTDIGPSFGLGLAYWFSPRVAIRIDGAANLLPGTDFETGTVQEGPDINLFHYDAGLQFELTDPRRSPFRFSLNVGAGGTTFDSDEFVASTGPGGTVVEDFSQTYFSLEGGLGLGYDLGSNVEVFLDGRWYLVFTDQDDTAVFAQLSPEIEAQGFDTASVIPLTLGLRIRTN